MSNSQTQDGGIDTKKAFIEAVRNEGVVVGDKRFYTEGEGNSTSYFVADRSEGTTDDITKGEVEGAYDAAQEQEAEMRTGGFLDAAEDGGDTEQDETESDGTEAEEDNDSDGDSDDTEEEEVEQEEEADEEEEVDDSLEHIGTFYYSQNFTEEDREDFEEMLESKGWEIIGEVNSGGYRVGREA